MSNFFFKLACYLKNASVTTSDTLLEKKNAVEKAS